MSLNHGGGGGGGRLYEPHTNMNNNNRCQTLIRALKWIPVLFIVAIIGWSYYAYVVQLCLLSVKTVTEQVLFLFFFHIVFIMFCWAYLQTVFTPIATVPNQYRLPPSEVQKLARAENAATHKHVLESFARDLPISNRTPQGTIRYCEKCQIVKPDRAHHCSMCGVCVLKMDHHCPWVNTCVNFSNYKYFILFLGYALVYCIYVSMTSLRYFIMFWEGQLSNGLGKFHILFLFFVSIMFSISLVSLFGYHIYLVALNRTTLEAFRAPIFRVGGPDKNGYHLGHYNNLQEVFGDDHKRWVLPVFTSLGEGLEFPQRSDPATHRSTSTAYHSMDNTTTPTSSIGDGVNYPILHMDEDTESLLGGTGESSANNRDTDGGETDINADSIGFLDISRL